VQHNTRVPTVQRRLRGLGLSAPVERSSSALPFRAFQAWDSAPSRVFRPLDGSGLSSSSSSSFALYGWPVQTQTGHMIYRDVGGVRRRNHMQLWPAVCLPDILNCSSVAPPLSPPLTSHEPHKLLYVYPSALLFVKAEGQSGHVRIGQLDVTGLHRLHGRERERERERRTH
jgi:hypothetical protein